MDPEPPFEVHPPLPLPGCSHVHHRMVKIFKTSFSPQQLGRPHSYRLLKSPLKQSGQGVRRLPVERATHSCASSAASTCGGCSPLEAFIPYSAACNSITQQEGGTPALRSYPDRGPRGPGHCTSPRGGRVGVSTGAARGPVQAYRRLPGAAAVPDRQRVHRAEAVREG